MKSARRQTPSSTRWLSRHLNDPYVAAAKAQGYRARSAFKLKELDEKFGILKGAKAVIDLGAAPGGWSQIVREVNPNSKIVGIDLLAIEPMAGVTFLQHDFLDPDIQMKLSEILGSRADVVLSDMAANTVGHKQTDHLRTMGLCEVALQFAETVLKIDGIFVAKVFAGGADPELLKRMKQLFKTVKHAKPAASRKESSEWYVVAKGFRGYEDVQIA